jgi:hypothetical protein
MVFSDGRGLKPCSGKATLAVTEPGSVVVFICPTAFVEAMRGNPEYASVTLIHEMLHSLGLGENPPRSRDITERVQVRCGSRAEVAPPPSGAALKAARCSGSKGPSR